MDMTTLFKISYGMYILSSKKGDRINAQLSNTVVQISPEPPTILASVSKNNLTHEFIEESGVFTISIISTECKMTDIGPFGFRSGRDFDKFHEGNFQTGKNGAPYLKDNMIGYVECEVIRSIDSDSHTLFIGKVTESETLNPDLEPMTYDFYRKELHGKLSKNATHYQKDK